MTCTLTAAVLRQNKHQCVEPTPPRQRATIKARQMMVPHNNDLQSNKHPEWHERRTLKMEFHSVSRKPAVSAE